MTKKQILKELNGQEIWSVQFEDCVAVQAGKVYRCCVGDVVIPTVDQAKELWQEALEQGFGTRNVQKLLEAELRGI